MTRFHVRFPHWLCFSVVALSMGAIAFGQAVPASTYDGMRWRLVGPFRGGRSETAVGLPNDPNVYYFGAVAGGVWRTTNGGVTWTPIFDHEPVASIGAIAVAPSNRKIIYVGTGEPCLRNDISDGDGVYKSIDEGRTWTNIGLRDTQHISNIWIDPTNPDIVFVAAVGHAFGPNEERGLFRSADGGKTWQKVLYVDDKTGATDLAVDPNNSKIMFAAMYQVRRTAYSMISGGPGSGLYKSVDGGQTWRHLEGHGLPGGILGRIGVAVSGANSRRVYAIIEAEKNALYRSDDGGENWQMVNDNPAWVRPWYQNHVFADPKNQDVVYLLFLSVSRSTDGGHTFQDLPVPHSDNHDLWIDPSDPNRMINANDGGATITVDGGKTWTPEDNQPTAQFYHVSTDKDFNYYLYGSQQDSGSVAIEHRTDHGDIDYRDWHPVGGGESGFIWPDPRDAEIVYGGDHNGHFTRYDGHTGQTETISPWFGARAHVPAELAHRFQWTAGMALSPYDPNVLYIGAEVLFKSTTDGRDWTIISPDLTRNDKSKQQSSPEPLTPDNSSSEYYDTIFAVAESPVERGLIWAGSDDGLVHLTKDGGKHWTDITPKQLPQWSRVNLIEPSPDDAGTAYMAADLHFSDDFRPMIFKTTDFGKTWTMIVNGLPANDYVHSVRLDPKRKGLLYAGTERGIYISFDDGGHWQSLQLNLPPTPIYDTTVHGDSLAVATHGRAFWMIDDIAPLREASAAVASSDVHLYTPALAWRERAGGRGPGAGAALNAAQNPPAGAVIDYYLQSAPPEPITLEILDPQQEVVRKFTQKHGGEENGGPDAQLPAHAGLNRFIWNFREDGPKTIPGLVVQELRSGGPLVAPGKYQVKLSVAGREYTAPLEIRADPRVKATQADLERQFTFSVKIRDRITQIYDTVREIRAEQATLESHRSGASASLAQTINRLEQELASIEGALIQPKSVNMAASLVFPIELDAQYAELANVIESADVAPPQQTYEMFQVYEGRWEKQQARWKAVQAEISKLGS